MSDSKEDVKTLSDLKVGDEVVYFKSRFSGDVVKIVKVTRRTKTRIFVEGVENYFFTYDGSMSPRQTVGSTTNRDFLVMKTDKSVKEMEKVNKKRKQRGIIEFIHDKISILNKIEYEEVAELYKKIRGYNDRLEMGKS